MTNMLQFAGAFDTAFAVADAANGGHNVASLAALRHLLSHYTREQFDAGLRLLRGHDGHPRNYTCSCSDWGATPEEIAAAVPDYNGWPLVYVSKYLG